MMQNELDVAWNLLVELRKEIIESQKIRTQIIGFKITFVSAGIGLIAANTDKISLTLLVIPAFAAIFFDLLITSYSFSIKRIGYYCRKKVEPIIREACNVRRTFPLWEEFVDRPEVKKNFAVVGNLGITVLALIPAGFVVYRHFPSSPYIILFLALLAFFAYDLWAFFISGRSNFEKKREETVAA